MQGLTAVVTTADADPGGIDQSGDVVGMHAIHNECGEGTTLGLLIRRRPQDPDTIIEALLVAWMLFLIFKAIKRIERQTSASTGEPEASKS